MSPRTLTAGDFCLSAMVIYLLLHGAGVHALELEKLFKRSDQRAVELLENGQPEAAANEFEDQQWRGVSRYKAGLYQEALEDFSAAEDAKGLYNHGTAAARAGDYTQAVASLEQALKLAPQDTDIAHNLDVARQLKDLSENQQQDQQQNDGDQSQESESNENSEESEQQNESSDDQQGEQQDGEQGGQPEQSEGQSEGDPQQSENQAQNDSQENSGEMNTDENDQASEEQQQGAEDLREMMQQEQQQQQNESQESKEQQMAASASESVSEDDQATEQWLRRIPDDASQLLRNKIRLNHLIEYPEVNDLQEPW